MKNFYKILAGTAALSLVILLAGAPPAGASSAVLRFDPAAPTLSVGQATAVNIQIDNVSGLVGIEVHLSFDPAILTVQDANPNADGVQIAVGSFIKADFVAQNTVDLAQGKIDFSILQLPPNSAVSGSGVLATITFVGKASGTSQIVFNSANLADANASAIAVTTQNGQATVGSTGPTATPIAPTSTPVPSYPTSTPVPGYPTSTPVPSYPTATPVPGYPTATPVPGYPTATPVPGYPTPTPMPSSGGILGYHTVRQGETLFCIGRAYSVLPWSIATQNSINYPYSLRVGQALAIPNVPWANPPYGPVCPRQFGGGSTPPQQPTPPPSSGCQATYVVQRGDTLSSIARRYGTTAWAIAVTNNITNPNLIFPGQSLCIR